MRFQEYRDRSPVDIEKFLGGRLEEYRSLGEARYRQIIPIDHRCGGGCMVTLDPTNAAKHIAAFYDFLAETALVDHIESQFDPWVPDTTSGLIVGESVVDIGCCNGYYTTYYALNHPAKQFVGVDLSEKPLNLARDRSRRYGVENVRWIHGNANNIQFTETDTFVLNNVSHELYGGGAVFPHLSAIDMFGEFVRLEGRIIISQEVWSSVGMVLDGVRSTADILAEHGFEICATDFVKGSERSCYIASFEKTR